MISVLLCTCISGDVFSPCVPVDVVVWRYILSAANKRIIQPSIQSFSTEIQLNLNLQQVIPATSPLAQLGFSLPAIKWQESNLWKHPCTVARIKTSYCGAINENQGDTLILGVLIYQGSFPSSPHLPGTLGLTWIMYKMQRKLKFENVWSPRIFIVATFSRMMCDTNLQNFSPCSEGPYGEPLSAMPVA